MACILKRHSVSFAYSQAEIAKIARRTRRARRKKNYRLVACAGGSGGYGGRSSARNGHPSIGASESIPPACACGRAASRGRLAVRSLRSVHRVGGKINL